VDADLLNALWALIALTGLLLPVWYVLSWTPLASEADSFPVGTPITEPAALALDEAEAERFDTDVFGSPERREPNALGDLRLPPQVPMLEDRLWLPPPSSELASREARSALNGFERCAESLGCDPRQGGVLQEALAAVSRPAAEGGMCNGETRTSKEAIQVPLGLHAIVLGWLPECREKAVALFEQFRIAVEKNSKSRNLPPPYSVAGQLYARFALAKLGDPARQPGSPELLAEMRAIRKEILANRELREHYEKLDEVREWGLSMAEIQGEWLMAEARALAREGRGPGLTHRLQRANILDPQVLEHLPSPLNQSPGQSRLRLAWCALALRADLPDAFSDVCLTALAQARSFPALHCAVLARTAIRSGRWGVSSADCNGEKGSSEGAAANVFDRLARNGKVWWAALHRYREAGISESEHATLAAYLGSYAAASGNTLGWFAAQHPRQAGVVAAGVLVLLLGWIALAWAYFIRRRTLQRFLPPRLQADTL